MTNYGFTAARRDYSEDAIIGVLKNIGGDEHTYITGGAIGGDAVIGRWLAENYPAARHLVILPTKKDQVDYWWEGLTNGAAVHPVSSNGLVSYRDRNLIIVTRSDVLYGFPAYPEDHPWSQRSGSWQTIRMARRKQIPHHVYVQNEQE